MKLLALFFILISSSSAFSITQERLSFNGPDLQVKKVFMKMPLETNLINLHLMLPSETMLASVSKQATKEEIDSLEAPMWVDDLRLKLKSSNGQLRL